MQRVDCPGVRRALFAGLGSSEQSGYSHWHSPTGRRQKLKKEQREQMQQSTGIRLSAVRTVVAYAGKPNNTLHSDANSFAVGALRLRLRRR
jgi:hypothetical protein